MIDGQRNKQVIFAIRKTSDYFFLVSMIYPIGNKIRIINDFYEAVNYVKLVQMENDSEYIILADEIFMDCIVSIGEYQLKDLNIFLFNYKMDVMDRNKNTMRIKLPAFLNEVFI